MTERDHGGYPEGSYGYQMFELQYRLWDWVDSLPLPLRTLVVGWLRIWSWWYRITGIESREQQRELNERGERIQRAYASILYDSTLDDEGE